MNVCMLGGTGFVGQVLAARLVSRGHVVKILTRHADRPDGPGRSGALQLVEADVHQPEVLQREFRGQDAVINLVGILNEHGRDGAEFRKVHFELTRQVVLACQAVGVPILLHMSALMADAAGGRSHYQRTKGAAEDFVRTACAQGPSWAVFRPSVIFGPRDSFINRFAALLRTIPLVFPLACPDARFAPVHVEDVASAYVICLETPRLRGRSYDLCGPEVLTLRDIVRYTAHTLGLKRWIIGLPDWASRLQARVFDFVPGKPFSTDNYLSAQVANVCSGDDFSVLGIVPASLRVIVPGYLRARSGHRD
jgi:uncharacterized protein YbjT (DUF2867 family)